MLGDDVVSRARGTTGDNRDRANTFAFLAHYTDLAYRL